MGLAASLGAIWRRRALRWLALAAVCNGYVLFANQFWTASFYIRAHHLPISTAALLTALIVGVGGGSGAIFAGVFAANFARRDRRWYGWLPALAMTLAIPTGIAQFFVSSLPLSVALGFVTMMAINVFMPLAPTIHQSIVPAGLRGFTSAMMLVVANIIGTGFGPLVTGLISDLVATRAGDDSLRYAVSASFAFAALAAFAYFRTGQHLKDEMPSGEAPDPQSEIETLGAARVPATR